MRFATTRFDVGCEPLAENTAHQLAIVSLRQLPDSRIQMRRGAL